MKNIIIILILAIAFCGLCIAASKDDLIKKIFSDLKAKNSVLLQLNTKDDGSKKVYTVYSATRKQIEQCPEWAGESDPPMPLVRAIQISREYLKKKYPKHDSFSLTSIGVNLINSDVDDNLNNRWYYMIDLQAKVVVKDGWANESFLIVLLMNGTILDPEVYK